MRLFTRAVLIAVVAYLGVVGALFAMQRSLQYPAVHRITDVVEAQLPGFEDVVIETEDGERLRGFWKAPEQGRVLTLYFHGNGGSLWNRRNRARALGEEGRGVLIVSYRGYSGSTGSPTEAGLHRDARAAFHFATERVEPQRILVYGESLGTGVATRLAAENEIGALVLDAPFTSAVDIAAVLHPFAPLRYLMLDQFRSIDVIGDVRAPILIMHGDADLVVPFSQGEALFAAAPEPKRFVRFAGAGHVSLLEDSGLLLVRAMQDALERGEAEDVFAAFPPEG
ncbi:MAG: alpha/beta hydrolase [Salinarimonadaceae bacterium]|nr:MAG: alpha/beta hydrolase [Salinarimonadaceae bacterium]